jgi:hypothetical protein
MAHSANLVRKLSSAPCGVLPPSQRARATGVPVADRVREYRGAAPRGAVLPGRLCRAGRVVATMWPLHRHVTHAQTNLQSTRLPPRRSRIRRAQDGPHDRYPGAAPIPVLIGVYPDNEQAAGQHGVATLWPLAPLNIQQFQQWSTPRIWLNHAGLRRIRAFCAPIAPRRSAVRVRLAPPQEPPPWRGFCVEERGSVSG